MYKKNIAEVDSSQVFSALALNNKPTLFFEWLSTRNIFFHIHLTEFRDKPESETFKEPLNIRVDGTRDSFPCTENHKILLELYASLSIHQNP